MQQNSKSQVGMRVWKLFTFHTPYVTQNSFLFQCSFQEAIYPVSKSRVGVSIYSFGVVEIKHFTEQSFLHFVSKIGRRENFFVRKYYHGFLMNVTQQTKSDRKLKGGRHLAIYLARKKGSFPAVKKGFFFSNFRLANLLLAQYSLIYSNIHSFLKLQNRLILAHLGFLYCMEKPDPPLFRGFGWYRIFYAYPVFPS